MWTVGHNIGVTPSAPRPPRVRALLRRAVDDARFAHPVLALVSLALLCVMTIGAMLIPVPYVIERPGPAIDVLGSYEDEEILVLGEDEAYPTYPTEGALMMTTVSVDGGPGYQVTPAEVLVSWFDSSSAVMPRELLFPEDQTKEQTTLTNAVSMTTSQQGAVAVALDELGIDYEPVVMIAGVQEGAPAEGRLEPGDVLLSVAGASAGDVAGYQELIAATPEGQHVTMTVRRGDADIDLEVPTEMADGAARVGIVLSPGFDFPVDIDITVGEIGGPSAGMIFSLSVYDELTPGALTGGHDIAGTGTIDLSGEVGAIGGIRQKMVGAQDAGAEFFLAPSVNCAEVVGHEPDGLDVVAVSTFEEALEAVTTIAETGSTDSLPTCEDR